MSTNQTNLSLQHLQLEMARIDLMIQRDVRRWQLAGQDPNESFRGLYVTNEKARSLIDRPFGASLGHTVSLDEEDARAFEAEQAMIIQQIGELVETAERNKHILRLVHLVEIFGLDRFELDAFLICMAPTLDLRYESLYGYLQDDVTRKRASVSLILDLLAQPGTDRLVMLSRFADDAPLMSHRLLERIPQMDKVQPSLLSQSLVPDSAIVTWLLGDYRPSTDLSAYVTLTEHKPNYVDDLLAAPIKEDLLHAVGGGQPVLVFRGQDFAGQQAAIRLASTYRQRPLFKINLAGVINAGIDPLHAINLAVRDARLLGATLCCDGWDACLKQGIPTAVLLDAICAHPDLVIIAGESDWQAQGTTGDRLLIWLEFPMPSHHQRETLWQHYLNQYVPGIKVDTTHISGQFSLTTSQIRDAVLTARDIAARRSEKPNSLDLLEAARIHSNPELGNMARKIKPRYSWTDIILPREQTDMLREIVSMVRGRPQVLEDWGVGKKLAASRGVAVLFAGEPGTGKTMSAEVIAGELGLELYKIDLSGVVSKYIGETEKNLERIFSEAQSSNAILFFDEADSIFGKRSEVKDAHDRYANLEISYLLQRMEAYDGVTILATNLRANLDEAFTRRLQFAIDFPFPEEEDRLRIWKTLFPPDVPRDKNIDLELLADRFKLAGGSIRNIIVSSAFLAAADGQKVTMKHLMHSIRREMQKMGRLMKETDLEI